MDADKAKQIEVAKTVVAIATKKGGLARDNLPEIVRSTAGGEKGFLQYMEKATAELKGAAYVIISAKGAELLLAAQEVEGVRFLTEKTAQNDPTFAERNDGVRVIVLRHIPLNLDVSKQAHLDFYADFVADGMCKLMAKMAPAMAKAGVIIPEEVEKYENVAYEVKNVETVSTFGKNYAHKSVKDRIYIVVKFFPRADERAAFKPKFIPHAIQIGRRMWKRRMKPRGARVPTWERMETTPGRTRVKAAMAPRPLRMVATRKANGMPSVPWRWHRIWRRDSKQARRSRNSSSAAGAANTARLLYL